MTYFFKFTVQEQSPSLHNENGLLINNTTHSETIICSTSINNTQYSKQFSGNHKLNRTMGGGSKKGKLCFGKSTVIRRETVLNRSYRNGKQQQKKEAVKSWLFKGIKQAS